ncbi:dTDP-4-dehydrorhamnose reductase [Nitrosomonadales bacterium]|nr:dTDP-4-dehydrorhamnose reductase [Nitrosomonadales bacterium]
MKILLTGANGQVGHSLNQKLSPLFKVFALTHENFDLTNVIEMEKIIDDIKPNLIINPAAYTFVDQAEKDPELVFKINFKAPEFLALKSKNLNIPLIHFSTDYIFDGLKNKAYCEDDQANPKSIYGKSKHDGDVSIVKNNPNHIIIRTSWVYSLKGKNFLTTILNMAKVQNSFSIVSDQIGAPTSATHIANIVCEIVKKIDEIKKNNLYGVYNLTNSGKASWYDFAKAIVNNANELQLKIKCMPKDINPIKTDDFSALAFRPKNSLLNNQKIMRIFGIKSPSWQNELKSVMNGIVLDRKNDN